jgi:DNA processing protein
MLVIPPTPKVTKMKISDRTGDRLSDQERLDWLCLIRSQNVGPRTFRALIRQYGSARAALARLPDLARQGGIGGIRIHPRAAAERELAAAKALGISLIGLGEPEYPFRLEMIDDAPPLLAVRGNLAVFDLPLVGIVGARNASAAAVKIADRLARELGEAGFGVVSGLARGIDAAAHRASLATGTVAALAGGQDRIYPPENVGLAESILDQGVTVSEMPLGWEPRARDFPRRNRLISGLSAGVIVVEAARRSGSLITSRLALEQGREVFAVPGSPLDPRTEGSNGLLKQGATLITEAADVIAILQPILGQPGPADRPGIAEPERASPAPPATDPDAVQRRQISALLGPAPVLVDDLVRQSGASPSVVHTVLLELDLAGRLVRLGGGLCSLK